MKKVRIKQIGKYYFPQRRGMFTWNDITEHNFGEFGSYETIVKCKSLEGAKEYLKETEEIIHTP